MKPKISAIIVDDVATERNALNEKLKLYCPIIEVKALCANIKTAINTIETIEPTIVFLDIDLGKQTAFELLKHFDNNKFFEVIFVTGHRNNADYLYNAIKSGSADFIYKPVDPDELITAVNRALNSFDNNHTFQKLKTLVHNLSGIAPQQQKILLKNKTDGEKQITIAQIVFCESDNTKIHFNMVDKTRFTITGSLSDYEQLLEPYAFMRIQRSYLINLKQIAAVKRNERDICMNHYDTTLSCSRDTELWKAFIKKWESEAIFLE